MRTHARGGFAAVVLVLVLAIPVASAGARERIRSTVNIGTGETPSGQQFLKGKVKSAKAKCERNRNVVLYWDEPGPPPTFVAVADDATNANGRWRIDAPGTEIPPGRYFVKVTPIERRGDVCRRAKSGRITVAAP
jgi:hypothetical protein